MDCRDFLAHYSEHIDGRADAELGREMQDHEDACPRCRHYSRTVRQGIALLRSAPPLEVPPDFRARLDHRIFHIDDGAPIARTSLGSGTTTFSIFALASLLALAAWAPTLTPTPTFELPAVVAEPPPTRPFTLAPAGPTFSRSLSAFTSADFQDGIWGDAHALLFEYSSLSERRRGAEFLRTGVQ